MMINADVPLSFRVRLDMAIWMAVFGIPAMLAAWLLWRAWWREAGARLSALDGPRWLLAAAAATLPADRRDWGAAMAAELAPVPNGPGRWRRPRWPLAWCCPRGGCSRWSSWGCWVGWRRWRWRVGVGLVGPGPVVAVLALVGVAACAVATVYYLAEYPSYPQTRWPAIALSLPPVTAVVLAVVLAGCLWLGMRPPRWLLPDRVGRWFGFSGPILVVLPGSVVAAAVGRSFSSGLWACGWAVVLGRAAAHRRLAGRGAALGQVGRGLVLDGDGPLGVGANLVDAVRWTLLFWRCGPCPWECLARPPGAGGRDDGGHANMPISSRRPEPAHKHAPALRQANL